MANFPIATPRVGGRPSAARPDLPQKLYLARHVASQYNLINRLSRKRHHGMGTGQSGHPPRHLVCLKCVLT
jgi:hypothetical protein